MNNSKQPQQQPSMMAADRRVTAYQAHARRYCAMMRINPDTLIPVGHPVLEGVVVQTPQWYLVAERMFDLSVLLRSIADEDRARKAASDVNEVKPDA